MTTDSLLEERLPNVSPGEVIREDYLKETGMTEAELAKALSVPLSYLTKILDGHAPINENIAGRLSRALGCSSSFWMHMQRQYDEEKQRRG